MKENNGARLDLLPDDDVLTPWQQCIKKAMLRGVSAGMPYKNTKRSGFTEPFTLGKYTIPKDEGTKCLSEKCLTECKG